MENPGLLEISTKALTKGPKTGRTTQSSDLNHHVRSELRQNINELLNELEKLSPT
jgi:hypothetical protein